MPSWMRSVMICMNKTRNKIIISLSLSVLLAVVSRAGLFFAAPGAEIVQAAESTETDVTHSTSSFDPITNPDGYSAVLYNSLSGLPTSEANAIAQTSEGFIWIGGYSGLIRFDGVEFERLKITSSIASVTCLMVDDRDRLWIGTNESGVYVLERDKLTHYDEPDGLPSSVTRAIARDSQGRIYVATAAGLATIDTDEHINLIDYNGISDRLINDLWVTDEGRVYGLTNEGDVFTMMHGSMESYYHHEEFSDGVVACLYPDPDSPGYVYTEASDSVVRYGRLNKGFVPEKQIDISPLSQVMGFNYLDGRIWICARNGIGVIDDGSFRMLENVPMNNSVGHVMSDHEGNLWFTSTRQGVMKIVPNQFADLYEKYDLPEDVVNTTCVLDDRLYIGTDSGLTVIGPDGPVRHVPVSSAMTASGTELDVKDLKKMLDGIRIRSIIRDSRDRLWISTWRTAGLLRYDHGELMEFTANDGLKSDQVRTVYEAGDDRFIVADTGGVNIIEGNTVTASYGEDEGIDNTEILSVCAGEGSDILVGTDGGGIYIISGGQVRHLSRADGLTSGVVMRIKPARDRDIYWLVTGTSLAYMTSDYEIHTITSFTYSNNFDIYENSRGEAWILSSNGIYVTEVSDLIADEDVNPAHFALSNGLPSLATANSYSELTDDGDLYIAGTSGVSRINIDKPAVGGGDLKASVPYIDADGIRIYPDEKGRFTVASNVRRLTIYAYVYNYSLIDPQITYRLEGFDREDTFVSRSEMDQIYYTNLRGGDYRFVLTLKDPLNKGVNTITVPISKQKAFYEHLWFIILMSAAIVAWIVICVRAYVNKRIADLEKQHKEEAEKERISNELQMASSIQNSMLPHEFPPFPDSREFDIYASMDPARDVGGDFYDFFMTDEDHLCIVIADVSGKGIPAALFMMMSKIILQSCAMLGVSVSEVLEKTNSAICSKNESDMFVTVWIGILDIRTGVITAANAGHEFPALMQDGRFTLLKDKHGFVIGGIEGTKYKEYEIHLSPGDKLFLYTDGVPEATSPDDEMFGTDRMIDALNIDPNVGPEQILSNVRQSIDAFVADAEQFDDLTMLCLEYHGPDSGSSPDN